MILDGDKTTYYHNKWKNGSVNFPHTFTFEAPDTVTVSSIELYQSRESTYRAKQLALFVSNDKKSWTTVSSRLAVEDTEYPTIELAEPVSAKYFRLRFTAGYGTNLVINELYFKHEYRLADLLALAQQILDESDTWGNYAPADLEALRAVYADGTCTDIDALRGAIEELGQTAHPLTYGVVAKAESFTPLAVYQLHNASGYGDLIATTDNALTIVGSTVSSALEAYRKPCPVSDPYCNWMILHSDKYKENYLYNLGAKKYVYFDGKAMTLSDMPMPINITKSGNGFYFTIKNRKINLKASAEVPVVGSSSTGSTAIFQLRTNQYLKPDEEVAFELSSEAGQALHENGAEGLFQKGVETYSKAFVAQPNVGSKLIRGTNYLSSNANTTQQSEHNLDKLIDNNIDTYYETWYSGINWPEEMSYIQASTPSEVTAIAFSFTPSQNPEYGLPDIPNDILITASPNTQNLLPVARLSEGFPSSISDSYTSPVIFTDGKTRILRFQVMQTVGNRANSHVFAMSEFQIHEAIIDETASPYYTKPAVLCINFKNDDIIPD